MNHFNVNLGDFFRAVDLHEYVKAFRRKYWLILERARRKKEWMAFQYNLNCWIEEAPQK